MIFGNTVPSTAEDELLALPIWEKSPSHVVPSIPDRAHESHPLLCYLIFQNCVKKDDSFCGHPRGEFHKLELLSHFSRNVHPPVTFTLACEL